MRIRPNEGAAVLHSAEAALAPRDRIVLAVSGGLDSMVLLDAVAEVWREKRERILVATFDHRTGPHSAAAVEAVIARAKALGVRFLAGQASGSLTREHEWREGRWNFLREAARGFDAPVATAHTLDDQVETVFMRILRDAGARGLAGLYAESDIVRPFLALRRADLVAYAAERGIRFVEDPSNASRAHLRNRVRHELLPAIARVRPGFPDQLLTIADRAAGWRHGMERIAGRVRAAVEADGALSISLHDLRGFDAESLRVLWPALAARAGIVMDRRGTWRLAEFTMKGSDRGVIQLSGGVEARILNGHVVLRRWDAGSVESLRHARSGRRGMAAGVAGLVG